MVTMQSYHYHFEEGKLGSREATQGGNHSIYSYLSIKAWINLLGIHLLMSILQANISTIEV